MTHSDQKRKKGGGHSTTQTHDMESTLATVAAVFLLFTAACCAPASPSPQDACIDARSSSLKLNQEAKNKLVEARNGSKELLHFSTSLLWMESKDMCDPGNLKQKTGPCIEKILDMLKKYSSALNTVAQFPGCSAAHDLKPHLDKLQKDVSLCVNSQGAMTHFKEFNISEEVPNADWKKQRRCHYTLDRLFSFSIIVARVFAMGDPAHHDEGMAQSCM